MSTVPKLTYAKVGKGSKAKAESASSELLRSKDQKSEDIFSYMNQQNLNYIKKQLKLKKNRSEHQPPRSSQHDGVEVTREQDEQVTQRYKLYQKYRGEEEVSEKEPHLEDTQRRSQQGKGVGILLPEEIEEDYYPQDSSNQRHFANEKQFISSSHHGISKGKFMEKAEKVENKMYQSLPYEEGKKRIASIEGYFGEAVSTNLNRQDGQFIQFLEEYICDLNHSKNLKSRQNEDGSIQKHRNEGYMSQRKRTASREGSQKKYNSKMDYEMMQNMKKLERLNRNSDTFGEHNSKYTINSNHSVISEQKGMLELEQKMKEEKLKSIMLAKQIQKQRKLLAVKEDIIKKIETDYDLLREELRHVKIQQSIINKGKKSVPQLGYSGYGQPQKPERTANDQNQLHFYEAVGSLPQNHQRNASNNHHKTAYSYRSSLRPEDGQLFQQFGRHNHNEPLSRQRTVKRDSDSVQKLQKEYNQFLREEQKQKGGFRGGKVREGLL